MDEIRISDEERNANRILDGYGLTPEENNYAKKLSGDLMGYIMQRCSGVGAQSIRGRAISAAIEITLQAFKDTVPQ